MIISVTCILFLALALTLPWHQLVSITNHSSLPDSLLLYQLYLREVYHSHNYFTYSKPSDIIAFNRPKAPISLLLIHETDKIATSHSQFAFPIEVDEIQKQLTTIKTEEIGSLMGNTTAHFVLIEGAPGVGKSTLCWQLCKLWSEGKLQHEWDLVVLVELRDETTRKATSVYDLLYHPNEKIRNSLAQEIQEREGKGLMVIFDGCDELPDDQRSELSLVQQILTNRILYRATIVVTSCPFATRSLPGQFRQYLDEHIRIAGFNETDIHTYITLACKDNIEMSQSLHSYVSSRPFILSVMHNPLHCTFVTELFIQYWHEQEVFAPTITSIYTSLVLFLLRRSLPSNQSYAWELKDLPTRVFNNLMQLAELAAKGIETSQYIYNNVPCDTLGLMVSVRQLYDLRPKKTVYMFLHLSLQQYLSALYWSKQPKQRQFEFLQRQNISDIMTLHQLGLENHTELSTRSFDWPHLLFLAGLTKLASFPLEVNAANNSKAMYIGPMCQLLFETQSSQIVSNVFSNRTLEVNLTLNDHVDWFVIAYCIFSSSNTSSWNILNVGSPQELQLLSNGLHYFNRKLNRSSRLAINMTIRTSANEYFKVFPKLYPFTKAVSHLNLYHSTYLDADGFSVLQNLSHYCPNMQTLYLLLDSESVALTESPRLPRETLFTIGLALPQFSVVFDSLHEYSKLRELHLYAKDR